LKTHAQVVIKCNISFLRRQEERVFNSLSFFVAAMALTVNVLGYIVTKLPPLAPSIYSVTTHTLVIAAGILMVVVIGSLLTGVRERLYRLPPDEIATLRWAADLRTYYKSVGLGDQALSEAVVGDLRAEMVREIAESVVHNRRQNALRIAARTRGIILMVIQLTLAFLLVGIIFMHDRFFHAPNQASVSHVPGTAINAPAAPHGGSDGPKATPSPAPVRGQRLQNSRP